MAQSEGRLSRRGFIIAMGGAAAAGGIAFGISKVVGKGRAQRQQMPDVVATRISQTAPASDPLSPLWGRAQEMEIDLLGQAVIMPFRKEPSIPTITVRALHDGQTIAFRLQWDDPERDDLSVKVTQFQDACAVFLGPYPRPPELWYMGTPDSPVCILQWRADWQKDVDEGFQDLEAAFPNASFDYYPPLAKGPWPPKAQDYPPQARVWLPGWAVGNPLSQPDRKVPVQKLMGTGPGTLAPFPTQNAVGKGVWKEGRWLVAVGRPLAAADANEIALAPGQEYALAFALWLGSKGDIGPRKSITQLGRLTLKA